jgi:hypothetical protein
MHRSEIFKSSYLPKSKSNYLSYIILALVVIGVYCYFNTDISEGFENAKNMFFNSQTTLLSGTDNLQNGSAVRYESNNEVYLQIYANLLLLDQHIYKDQYNQGDSKHSYKVYLGNGTKQVFIGDLSFGSDKVYKLRGKTDISANMYHNVSITVSDGITEHQVLHGRFSG